MVVVVVVVGCSALLDCVCDGYVCGWIEGKTAVHDLETGRVHRGRSMKGERESRVETVEPGRGVEEEERVKVGITA